MTDAEAIAVCRAWFAYLDRQEAKSLALQKLAAEARRGLDQTEVRRKLAQIDNSPTVFDGAYLQPAVEHLVAALEAKHE